MIFILVAIFCTWAIVMGVTIVTQKDMALHKIRVQLEKKNNKIFEPLLLCEWCMPSIYSIFGYLFSAVLFTFKIKYLILYPIIVSVSSVLCGYCWGNLKILLYNLKTIKDEDEN